MYVITSPEAIQSVPCNAALRDKMPEYVQD